MNETYPLKSEYIHNTVYRYNDNDTRNKITYQYTGEQLRYVTSTNSEHYSYYTDLQNDLAPDIISSYARTYTPNTFATVYESTPRRLNDSTPEYQYLSTSGFTIVRKSYDSTRDVVVDVRNDTYATGLYIYKNIASWSNLENPDTITGVYPSKDYFFVSQGSGSDLFTRSNGEGISGGGLYELDSATISNLQELLSYNGQRQYNGNDSPPGTAYYVPPSQPIFDTDAYVSLYNNVNSSINNATPVDTSGLTNEYNQKIPSELKHRLT